MKDPLHELRSLFASFSGERLDRFRGLFTPAEMQNLEGAVYAVDVDEFDMRFVLFVHYVKQRGAAGALSLFQDFAALAPEQMMRMHTLIVDWESRVAARARPKLEVIDGGAS